MRTGFLALLLPVALAATAAATAKPVATSPTPTPLPGTPLPGEYKGTPVLEQGPTPTPIETRCAKKKKKKNTWVLTRSGRDEILGNRIGLKYDTRVSDYFADGKRSGTMLTTVLGGLGASCGFELGDVLKTVNGIDADDEHLPRIEAEFRKATRIEIELVRDGKRKTFVYDIE